MQSVEASILNVWPVDSWSRSISVVGVSGGPDSVALLHCLRKISDRQARLVVAHIDHGLRGVESDNDREFVRDLAERWQLPCEIVRLSEHEPDSLVKSDHRPGSEESLRKARHRHLRKIALRHGAIWIATAHHADDVVETMLHRLLRGSGPRGLASIPPMRKLGNDLTLIHPLLSVSRADIIQYLQHHGLEFRNDASNASDAYTRNRIRHQLIPYLREFAGIPHLDQRLWQASQQIREEHQFVETAARRWLEMRNSPDDTNGAEFPAPAFEAVQWCVVREGLVTLWHDLGWPLQGMAAKHWDRLRNFLQPIDPGPHPRRMQLPGQIEVTMRRGIVRFFKNELLTD